MQRYSPAADVKATSYMAANGDGAYYLASEVDARIAELEAALRDLLEDTQHVGHDCGDSPAYCPVIRARAALNPGL